MDLNEFAEEVGGDGPVTIAGMSTRGGPVDAVRTVTAPVGVRWVRPEEMTVCCGAGTSMAELDATLDQVGQYVRIPPTGTVGGALSVGQSGVRRLGHGPVRDAVLQISYVSAAGQVVRVGGPTVKNVTGFDLCRLLVGARGTLGFLGEVILRTHPRPSFEQWYCRPGDPEAIQRTLYRPVSILWDGHRTHVLLEGDERDVLAEAQANGLQACDPPHMVEHPHRWSVPPREIRRCLTQASLSPGEFIAEVGVGMMHLRTPAPLAPVSEAVRTVHQRIKHNLDPTGRLNPGVDVLGGAAVSIGQP